MRKILSPYVMAVAAFVFGSFSQASGQCSQWNTGPFPSVGICTNGPLITISGGTPAPGVYFGPGVIGGPVYQFSPITAGPGVHTLGYSAASCSDTAYINVNVFSPPIVTLSALGPFCENQDSVALTGGLPTAGGTGYYYGPGVNGSSGNFGPTIGSGGSPYNINYTFKNAASGCADTATVSVNVNPVTAASLSGLDTAYCSNAIPQTVLVTTSPSGGTLTGPGISGSIFNINNAGVGNHNIKYFYTNATNCTDTAYAPVHVRALPTVLLSIPGAQKFVCEFDATYGITGQTPTSPGWPSSWFTGTGVDTILGTFTPGTPLIGWNVITYHHFDGVCTNTAIDSILVNANPTVLLDPFPEPCANDVPFSLNQGSPTNTSATYSGPGVTGGSGVYFYDPSVAGAGTHTITYCYTAANGCETCVSQNIIVNPIPALTFNSPSFPIFCENTGGTNLNDPVYVSPTGGKFAGPGIGDDSTTWFPIQLGAGSYNIVYTYTDTSTGCGNSTSQSLTIYPTPKVQLTTSPASNQPILDSMNVVVKMCLGDSVVMTYSSSPTVGNLQPIWNLNFQQIGNSYYYYPDTSFYYAMIGLGNNGCVDTASVDIVVIQPAEAEIIGLTNICIGDSTVLEATGATSYQWLSPSATTAAVTVAPTVDTYYEVIALSDVDGDNIQCSSDTTAVEVRVNPLPLITARLDTTIFLGDEVLLKAFAGISYVWSGGYDGELSCTDCESPTATPIYNSANRDNRIYYVIGTDSNNCHNSDSVIINLNPRVVIFVPTAFSPNGDGYNDVLKVETKGIKSYEFEIYDRYGRTVFETRDPEETWDGTVDGELLGKDIFLFRMTAKPFKSGIPIEQAGQISLIR